MCWTQDEIGESEGMTHGPVTEILSDFPILENQTKSSQTLATYSEPDWTPTPAATSEAAQESMALW